MTNGIVPQKFLKVKVQPSKISRHITYNKSAANKLAKEINETCFRVGEPTVLKRSGFTVYVIAVNAASSSFYKHQGEYLLSFIHNKFPNTHIIVPLSCLDASVKIDATHNSMIYCHEFVEDWKARYASVLYIGITNRSWLTRLKEHWKASSNFGKALRGVQGSENHKGDMVHTIIADGLTREAGLKLEGELINDYSLYPDGNNIMPGGQEGVEFARRFGLGDYETAADKVAQIIESPEELEKLCAKKYAWKPLTDEQKSIMVCNSSRNFSKEEVRFIRICSLTTSDTDTLVAMFQDTFAENESTTLKWRIPELVNGITYRFVA